MFVRCGVLIAMSIGCSVALFTTNLAAADAAWKAGTAKIVITPEKPMWMAGYGSRTKPAQGKLHDLWIKALALEDSGGHRCVILSSDTLGISRTIYDNTCRALKEKLGLTRSQIMLNSSHTHCGPVLRGALYVAYPLDEKQRALIDEYSTGLEAKIVDTVERAFADLKPAKLSSGQGVTRFAVNRRNNREADVPELIRRNALKGPVDHSVPVLSVRAPDGTLKAAVFGYACHNTTLSFMQWCGDYAGFAQMSIEENHPGAVAMFYMGCGADQNPLPRRNVFQSRRYGRMLAAAVEEVLLQPAESLEPTLRTEFEFVTLNFAPAPTRKRLQQLADGSSVYNKRWAVALLKQLDSGQPLARSYRYPLLVWKIGSKQLWISMGGEVTVDYSIGFKQQYGSRTWVTGYANDVMCYIPSHRVLKEGGYEGGTSMIVYGMPTERWADDIETLINKSAGRMIEKVNRPVGQ